MSEKVRNMFFPKLETLDMLKMCCDVHFSHSCLDNRWYEKAMQSIFPDTVMAEVETHKPRPLVLACSSWVLSCRSL